MRVIILKTLDVNVVVVMEKNKKNAVVMNTEAESAVLRRVPALKEDVRILTYED